MSSGQDSPESWTGELLPTPHPDSTPNPQAQGEG